MSISHPVEMNFTLDGEPLGCSYDEQADILYLWRGKKAKPAVSLTSVEGHLIRIDDATGEIVGFTVFDFSRACQPEGPPLLFTVPTVNTGDDDLTQGRVLELVHA